MAQTKKTLAQWEKVITAAIKKGNTGMLEIAGSLAAIHADKLYEGAGYKTVSEYAYELYEIGSTSTYDAITVFNTFGQLGTTSLQPEFKDFTFSQLKLMYRAINLIEGAKESPVLLLNTFTADMKCREITDTVKQLKGITQKDKPVEESAHAENSTSKNDSAAAQNTTQEDTSSVFEGKPESGVTYETNGNEAVNIEFGVSALGAKSLEDIADAMRAVIENQILLFAQALKDGKEVHMTFYDNME